MKRFLFVLMGISVLTMSISIAYYFLVLFPREKKNYETELKKIRREIQNAQNTQIEINSYEIKSRLEDIEFSMQEQETDRSSEVSCESNGGMYQGSGVCIYP